MQSHLEEAQLEADSVDLYDIDSVMTEIGQFWLELTMCLCHCHCRRSAVSIMLKRNNQ